MDNDDLDKILQSINTELQENKEIEDLKQIDDKFMNKIILDLNNELTDIKSAGGSSQRVN